MRHSDERIELLAGVGRCDITPAPGTPQGGWGAQAHQRGSGADLAMHATALVLKQGDHTILIVEADAIGFDPEGTERILDAIARLTGLEQSQIRFSCSHTHSGPNTFRLANISEGRDMILAYLEGLPQRIASAGWQALQGMEPVYAAATVGACRINRNRRVRVPSGEVVVGVNEAAAADPALGVMRFDRKDGTTLATIVHYACHPTTVGWQCDRFTPDYPGPARRVIEEYLGGVCLFLQGAAGDLGPRRGFTGDRNVYRRLGTELGLAAASLGMELDPLESCAEFDSVMVSGANIAQYRYRPVAHAPLLRMLTRTLQLPVKPLPSQAELEAELVLLRARAEAFAIAGEKTEMLRAQALATQAGWRLENSRRYAGKSTADWPMQLIRIGSCVFVSLAGEPFSSIARRIRDQSPARCTFVSGYSNGGFGYIPDRAAYREGGYEVEATPFSEDAADVVVDQALSAIQELFKEKIVP